MFVNIVESVFPGFGMGHHGTTSPVQEFKRGRMFEVLKNVDQCMSMTVPNQTLWDPLNPTIPSNDQKISAVWSKSLAVGRDYRNDSNCENVNLHGNLGNTVQSVSEWKTLAVSSASLPRFLLLSSASLASRCFCSRHPRHPWAPWHQPPKLLWLLAWHRMEEDRLQQSGLTAAQRLPFSWQIGWLFLLWCHPGEPPFPWACRSRAPDCMSQKQIGRLNLKHGNWICGVIFELSKIGVKKMGWNIYVLLFISSNWGKNQERQLGIQYWH